MKNTMLSDMPTIQNATDSFYKKEFRKAAAIYEDLQTRRPTDWWLAMEMYRNLVLYKKNEPNYTLKNKGHIVFTPDYRGNTYQGHLYSLAEEFGYSTTACNELPPSEMMAALMASHTSLTIHQHWLKEIYKNTGSELEAIKAVNLHIGKLKALKALGAKIIWTVHNILDHDLHEHHQKACIHALKEMALVSDKILIHSKNSEAAITDLTETSIPKEKFQLLAHPLYDELELIESKLPPELPKSVKVSNSKIFTAVGMIRPYKGIADLAEAISRLLEEIKRTKTHFIVAGRMMDPDAHQKLNAIKQNHPDVLTIIPRMISDNELAGLLKITDLAITPYRAILTSGSYYSATTFSKPVLAPNRGFFPEIIVNETNGYLYDGSLHGLEKALHDLMKKDANVFASSGNAAKLENAGNTTRHFSTKYFQQIQGWK